MSYFNIHGFTSTLNSTTTPLLTGTTFTGTGEQNEYPQVGVMLKADVEGTLFFDFSNDGTNWDSTFPVAGFEVSANIPEFHSAIKLGRWFRIRFLNNGVDQTFMRLSTYFGMNFVQSVSPLNQAVNTDSDATISRPTDFTDEVIRGLRNGVSHFSKFAYRENITAASGEQTVWAAPGNHVIMPTADTFTITYDNTLDGSTSTGALTLFFQYIDENGLITQTDHILGSTGSDVTAFSGYGINRISVSSSGTDNFNGGNITVTATTATTIQGYIPAEQSVTQQGIYHNSFNSFSMAKYLYLHVNKLSGGGAPRVLIRAYIYNRGVATRFEVFRHTIDTASETTLQIVDPIGFRLSPQDVLYFIADTDTNNTNINIRFSLLEYQIN